MNSLLQLTPWKPAIKKQTSMRCRRGALTAAILSQLKAAGEAGLQIKALAASLDLPYASIAAWFCVTGKRVPGIERITRGTYRFNPGAYPPGQPYEWPTIKSKVITCLEAAGEAGLRVKDLATMLGLARSSLSVWFYTTGKRVPEIERIAYGIYRYNPRRYQPCQPYERNQIIISEVISGLKAAGEAGAKVKDLASTLGVSNGHLGGWFAHAGKRVPEIERISRGVYRLRPEWDQPA